MALFWYQNPFGDYYCVNSCCCCRCCCLKRFPVTRVTSSFITIAIILEPESASSPFIQVSFSFQELLDPRETLVVIALVSRHDPDEDLSDPLLFKLCSSFYWLGYPTTSCSLIYQQSNSVLSGSCIFISSFSLISEAEVLLFSFKSLQTRFAVVSSRDRQDRQDWRLDLLKVFVWHKLSLLLQLVLPNDFLDESLLILIGIHCHFFSVSHHHHLASWMTIVYWHHHFFSFFLRRQSFDPWMTQVIGDISVKSLFSQHEDKRVVTQL